jgi:hypothetical protein
MASCSEPESINFRNGPGSHPICPTSYPCARTGPGRGVLFPFQISLNFFIVASGVVFSFSLSSLLLYYHRNMETSICWFLTIGTGVARTIPDNVPE